VNKFRKQYLVSASLDKFCCSDEKVELCYRRTVDLSKNGFVSEGVWKCSLLCSCKKCKDMSVIQMWRDVYQNRSMWSVFSRIEGCDAGSSLVHLTFELACCHFWLDIWKPSWDLKTRGDNLCKSTSRWQRHLRNMTICGKQHN